MEEVVCCKVADRLRGTMHAYAINTDDDLADEETTSPSHKKCHKAISGKLRTADNMVMKQITWSHELIYIPATLPAEYEALSPMLFVNGYLEVLAMVNEDIKGLMLYHLQELMADEEAYRWPMVLAYHAASRAGLSSVDRLGHQTEA